MLSRKTTSNKEQQLRSNDPLRRLSTESQLEYSFDLVVHNIVLLLVLHQIDAETHEGLEDELFSSHRFQFQNGMKQRNGCILAQL